MPPTDCPGRSPRAWTIAWVELEPARVTAPAEVHRALERPHRARRELQADAPVGALDRQPPGRAERAEHPPAQQRARRGPRQRRGLDPCAEGDPARTVAAAVHVDPSRAEHALVGDPQVQPRRAARRLRRPGRDRDRGRAGGRRRRRRRGGHGRLGRHGLRAPRPVDRHRGALDRVVAAGRARIGQGQGEPVAAALARLHDAEVERVRAGERTRPGAAADLLHAQQQRAGEVAAEAARHVHDACAQQRQAPAGLADVGECDVAGHGLPGSEAGGAEDRVRGVGRRQGDGALGRHAAELGGPLARGRGGRDDRDDERQQGAGGERPRPRRRHGPAPLPSQTLTGNAYERKDPV